MLTSASIKKQLKRTCRNSGTHSQELEPLKGDELVSSLDRNSEDSHKSTALASTADTSGTLTRYPCWFSMPSQQRDHRPRTFYPGTAFLPGTRPFSWKGTMQANRLSSELECLSLQEEHRTNALKSQTS